MFDKRYTEGDAWHYRFFVPQDPYGLIELFGSNDTFVKELDTFLYRARFWKTNLLPNPYYWAGNEHDLFSPFMFAYAGKADLTQKYVRWILKTYYTNTPNGLPGNDDYSTMSAWFLFSS